MNPKKIDSGLYWVLPDGRAESTTEKLERPFRLSSAYHEAGHAVVLLEGKFPEMTEGISIVPNRNSGGRTSVSFDPGTDLNLFAEAGLSFCTDALEHRVICLLAGREAARKLFGAKSGFNPRGDLKKARTYVAAMASDQQERPSMMRSLQAESKLMVETHWLVIEAVAKALFVEEEMDRERFFDIVYEANTVPAKQNTRI